MYCTSCRTQLPDEANFCWKCGKPQRPHVQPDEPKWEMCEIRYEKLKQGWTSEFRFWAEAIGPTGSYNAGQSRVFKARRAWPISNAESQEEINALIYRLTKAGWEALPRGEHWFSYRFRRLLK